MSVPKGSTLSSTLNSTISLDNYIEPKINVSEPLMVKEEEQLIEPIVDYSELSYHNGTPDITIWQSRADMARSYAEGFYSKYRTLLTATVAELVAFAILPLPVVYLHAVILPGLIAGTAIHLYQKSNKKVWQIPSQESIEEAIEAEADARNYVFIDLEAGLPKPMQSRWGQLKDTINNLTLTDLVKSQVMVPLYNKYALPLVNEYKDSLLVGFGSSAAVLIYLAFPYLNLIGMSTVLASLAAANLLSYGFRLLDSRENWEKDFATIDNETSRPQAEKASIEPIKVIKEGYFSLQEISKVERNSPNTRLDQASLLGGNYANAALRVS